MQKFYIFRYSIYLFNKIDKENKTIIEYTKNDRKLL